MTVAIETDNEPPIAQRIKNIKLYRNMSDNALLVDTNTYIRKHERKVALRYPPKYNEAADKEIILKTMDLMKQSIYATQYRLLDLERIMEKHSEEPAFRMAFIQSRLQQLLVDMRRLFTLGYKKGEWMLVFQILPIYRYTLKKYWEVIYIVEHAIIFHKQNSYNYAIIPSK
ncbi:unnamed protein product [Leptidea sinapis]|uniref:Uncharacterized protein n=1 Tax=Leptidea sinapis TaxID=189913 RepID=A0A5E4QR99_9NEOP|nr:unnamed protein product [Leptidea sinapis]